MCFFFFFFLKNLEQARPLLEEYAIEALVDPRLGNHYSEHEVFCMLHAASLCIGRDPHSRPRMSQVERTKKKTFISLFNFDQENSHLEGGQEGQYDVMLTICSLCRYTTNMFLQY